MHKVLVVDDDNGVLELYELVLSRAGYHVQMSQDAKSAVDYAMNGKPDIALIDYNLGDTNGIDLGMQIKRLHPKICLYLISGDVHSVGVDKCLEVGFENVLEKPISVSLLLASIATAVSRKPIT